MKSCGWLRKLSESPEGSENFKYSRPKRAITLFFISFEKAGRSIFF